MSEIIAPDARPAGKSQSAQPGQDAKKYIGEVSDIRGGHHFDAARLESWLRDKVPGYSGPLTIKQFDGGQSNPTYLLTTPTAKYVLRRKPAGVLLKSAHAVDREYRVIKALSQIDGMPVPEALALCEDESVIGSMFYVMRHVQGRVFWNCQMPDLSREERAAVFDSANATLAKLHTVDYVAAGLGDFGRPGNYFERQIGRWSKQYEMSKTEDIAEMDKLMAWLPANAPPDDGLSSIVHGDFSFHNLLIHPVEPRVVAIVDWELSTIGHPFGDLMYHAMEWYRPSGVDTRGTLNGADLKALGLPSMQEYIDRYCARTGFLFSGNVDFYCAFNLFRVAAILQGVAQRALSGNAAASNASEMAALIRPLAKAAWQHACAGGAV
ncbi:MAG: phosphotransferase family protein [Azonexus sp.]|jgi:aminoglycoside phosphotransferase (APT) family kinase protein|nr:phosphotransferase family protein [Azonexus sp.]